MSYSSKNRLTVLAAFLAGVVALPMPQAVAADNLMDLLFSKKRAAEPQPQAQPKAPRGAPSAPRAAAKPPAKAPVKRVVVAPPQASYNYRAEGLVPVDFSKFDLNTTASADTDGQMSFRLEPIGVSIDALREAQVKAEKEIAEAVAEFYATKQMPIWTNGYNVTAKAKDVAAFFAQAGEDGLDPDDYSVKIPSDGFDLENAQARLKQLAQFELMMTARALRYARDAGEGRINPNRLSGFHDFKRGSVNAADVAQQLATVSDPVVYLRSLHPQSDAYAKLKANLQALEGRADRTARVADGTLIRPGETNPEIRNVVALIRAKAPADYIAAHDAVLRAHENASVYDVTLVEAIKDFQRSAGRKADGVIGANTLSSLQGESISSKRERILYSMERLRWQPHDFGDRYVFINQPAYRAQYFEDGKEKLAMNVVIGSARNQTVFFYDTIETVVFNPSWGVPRSILINEKMPRILRDPGYLERSGYEVYNSAGKRVSSSEVNWAQVAANGGGVGIRQKPGPDNALGELKILFPNSHDIYMHDTPSKSAFKRDMRALSHGCVRLENPRGMAAAILGVQVDDLKQYFGKNERPVKVSRQIPVYVSYFTAWPNEKTGEIEYFDDVYDRDVGLGKAFEKTSAARQG
ncbi:MAG: L,D-transpeptidase family protein [Phyllobacterium sp.]